MKGNNDATEGGQFVPIDKFRTNLLSIVSNLRSVNPNMAIILPTLTRANKTGRSNEITAKYADVVRSLSDQHSRNAVLDLWIDDVSIESEDLCDGLHLGITGNAKLFNGLQRVVREKFPDLVPFNDSNIPKASSVFEI